MRDVDASIALRPSSFDDYVGQAEVVAGLRDSVRAAKRGGWQLDHLLLAGPGGLGKTTLSSIIAAELGTRLHVTSAPAIEHRGALASLLTMLEDGDILFIDEIHGLERKVETIYSALEDRVIDLPAGKRVIRVPLPRFTLLGATTHAGKLPRPLLDRFGFVWQLRPYTLAEMKTIVARSARKLDVRIDENGAEVIARASRGTPRIANRLMRRLRDAVSNAADRDRDGPTIDGGLATATLAKLGLDHLGLDSLDRRYLAIVAQRAVGIEALCAELGEDRSTVEGVVEPQLLGAGLIERGRQGRRATAAGIAHVGATHPSPTQVKVGGSCETALPASCGGDQPWASATDQWGRRRSR